MAEHTPQIFASEDKATTIKPQLGRKTYRPWLHVASD